MTFQVIDTWQGNVVIQTFDTEQEAERVSEMLNSLHVMKDGGRLFSTYGKGTQPRFWVDLAG